MSSTSATKGAPRPRAIALLVFLTQEGYARFEFPPFRALPSSFINLATLIDLTWKARASSFSDVKQRGKVKSVVSTHQKYD